MTILTLVATIVLGLLATFVGLSLVYHYFMALAGARRPRSFPVSDARYRFALLIPAHNEEAVIASTLDTLSRLQYPRECWDVYVAADHCTDATATLAREHGAICLERNEGPRGRKAYPLRWLIERLLGAATPYDAFVVLDADSHLEPDFLQRMRDGLAAGRLVLQGQHRIANPWQSPYTLLADADMRLNNLLRNQAKRNLGLSARLMGDAMCFHRSVLEQHGWPTESLGEDREYGMYLVAHGIRVTYVPEAVSYGQGALRWQDASAQRLRWQAGSNQMRRNQIGDLARRALSARDLAAVDQLAELLLPSYSMSVCLSLALLLLRLALFAMGLAEIPWGTVALVGLAAVFPAVALVAAHAPLASFGALALGPAFVAWRVVLCLRVLIAPASVKWIRTVRREELVK